MMNILIIFRYVQLQKQKKDRKMTYRTIKIRVIRQVKYHPLTVIKYRLLEQNSQVITNFIQSEGKLFFHMQVSKRLSKLFFVI